MSEKDNGCEEVIKEGKVRMEGGSEHNFPMLEYLILISLIPSGNLKLLQYHNSSSLKIETSKFLSQLTFGSSV